MTSYRISVPSKTFVVGEYIALKGGPTLLLATPPRFQLIATLDRSRDRFGLSETENLFHPDSPAGKLINRHKNFYCNYCITFRDPYQGLGGFGASTAQFLLLTAFKSHVERTAMHDSELLKLYTQLAWNGQGSLPSGADLIAQRHGGLAFFYKSENRLEVLQWPFLDLKYGLIHTGNKLSTHTYLQGALNFTEPTLREIALSAVFSVKNKDSGAFIEAIKNYRAQLQVQSLIAPSTEKMLKELDLFAPILAAKGCGSLGADVILILFEPSNENAVKLWVKEKQFNLIITGNHASEGLILREEQIDAHA